MKAKLKNEIQTFGRSLLLPIALMAPIGMILGLSGAFVQGYMIERIPALGNENLQTVLLGLRRITDVIFGNIPLLFAMGVAYGVSKKEKGIAVFSAVLGYLTLIITMNVYLGATGNLAEGNLGAAGQGMVLGIQSLRIDAVGGIIAGLVAAKLTDRFYKLELPLAFAFFSGKKSVPIITFLAMIPVGLVVPVLWGGFTAVMIRVSSVLMIPGIGVALFRTLNRLLIPFGLHHVNNSMLRFTEAGGTYIIDGEVYVGILSAMNHILFNLGPNHESWSRLMPTFSSYMGGGQMMTTLYRIPAIGLAMYHTAYAKNKKIAKGIILTIVLTAFLGNVTEPLEFSFLFIAPKLYFVYAVLVGFMNIPLQWLGVSIGYIRGTIFDFAIFGLLYENTNWIQHMLWGFVNFAVFYGIFRFAITKYNLKTPGREEDIQDNSLLNDKRYDVIADIVVDALGGKGNIANVDNCVTRLRIDLKDQKLVEKGKLKDAGASGTFLPQKNHIHIVFGPHVEFVRNAVDDLM